MADVGDDPNAAVELYRGMLLIRHFEERVALLFKRGELPGSSHLYIGQEAVAVGVCAVLTKTDRITSTHRGHGHLIAKGGDVRRLMAELFARQSGYCRGKGGSMHVADVSIGMLGAIGIVGGGLPIAVGSALASKIRGLQDVTVCFFGEGAANEGTFHEAANLAGAWRLPLVFVCENNLYGEWTPMKEVTSVEDIALRAPGYGMPGVIVDGQDVLAVRAAADKGVSRARDGHGPTLIEAKTYRFEGHFTRDTALLRDWEYRPQSEVDAWRARDPVATLRRHLVTFVDEEDLSIVEEWVIAMVDEAVEFSRAGSEPPPEDALENVFASA